MNKILRHIWIYPFKSMRGFEVEEAKLNFSGIENDRNWMLVDEFGQFMTAREEPRLLHFSTGISADQSELKIVFQPNHSPFRFPIAPEEGQKMQSEIWGDKIQTLHPSPQLSEYFSDCLQKKVFAVYSNKNSGRIKTTISSKKFRLNLADAFPFLILGTNSVEQLSAEYKEKIDIRRFRPNLIFTGGLPFEEDTWKKITIGESSFLCEKKCARCKVIALSPDTIEYNPEILKLMNRTRKINNQIFMGMNLSLLEGRALKTNSTLFAE